MKNRKFNNRDPVYVQVVRQFKEEIATGVLEPGQEIPSRRELASRLKINPNTAQRAYKEMEDEGLIYTEQNVPSRITSDEQTLKTVREELILQAVDAFVDTVHSIQIPVEEVVDLVREKYTEKNEEQEGPTND